MRKLFYTDKYGRRTEYLTTTDRDYKAVAISLLEASFEGNIGCVYEEKEGSTRKLDYYNIEL